MTTREALRHLVKREPNLTATEAARRVGVSRQRAQELARDLGIHFSRFGRGAMPQRELLGTTARAGRTLDRLRRTMQESRSVSSSLDATLRALRVNIRQAKVAERALTNAQHLLRQDAKQAGLIERALARALDLAAPATDK